MPLNSPLSLSLHPPLPPNSPWSLSPSPSRSRFPTAVLSSFIRHHKPSPQSPSQPNTPLLSTSTSTSNSTARPGEDFSNFIWDHQSIPDDTRPGRSNWEHEQALAEVARFYSTLINHHPRPEPPLSQPTLPLRHPSPPVLSPRLPAVTAAAAFCRRLHPKPAKTCQRDHHKPGKCSASCSSESSFSEPFLPSPALGKTTPGLPPLPKKSSKKTRSAGGSANTSSPCTSPDLRVLPRHEPVRCVGPVKPTSNESETEADQEAESEIEAETETKIDPAVLSHVPLRTTSIRQTRSLSRMKSGRTKIATNDYVIFNKTNVKV